MTLRIRRLSYAVGAEIIGVDFNKSIDDQTVSEIHSAFLEHSVLLFRGQPITREQHVRFSRLFGELHNNESYGAHRKPPEFPEITLNIVRPKPNGEPATGRINGQDWHSDRSHLPVAAQASLLRSVEIPEVGGDTMFANMYRAYDTLSDGMKRLLEGLHAVHMDGILNPRAAHPVVRVHPETGRKALYVGEQVEILVGMTKEESKPLIHYLTQHAVRPQNVYRHRWQKDDLVVWDNRCLLHIALADYDRTKVRHMERTTVNGNLSGYVYEGPIE